MVWFRKQKTSQTKKISELYTISFQITQIPDKWYVIKSKFKVQYARSNNVSTYNADAIDIDTISEEPRPYCDTFETKQKAYEHLFSLSNAAVQFENIPHWSSAYPKDRAKADWANARLMVIRSYYYTEDIPGNLFDDKVREQAIAKLTPVEAKALGLGELKTVQLLRKE